LNEIVSKLQSEVREVLRYVSADGMEKGIKAC